MEEKRHNKCIPSDSKTQTSSCTTYSDSADKTSDYYYHPASHNSYHHFPSDQNPSDYCSAYHNHAHQTSSDRTPLDYYSSLQAEYDPHHGRVCHRITGSCFSYGLTGHMAKDCLKNGRSGSNRNGNDKKLAAKGKVFSLTRDHATNSLGTVLGAFLMNDHVVFVFFNAGATHSVISIRLAKYINIPPTLLNFTLSISMPMKGLAVINHEYQNCLLRFDDKIRFANLFTLDMHNFDIILGMDWLTKHCATIISHTKSVIFDDLDKPEFVYQDSQLGLLASIMDTSGGLNNKRNRDEDRIQPAGKNNNLKGYDQRRFDRRGYDRQNNNQRGFGQRENDGRSYERQGGRVCHRITGSCFSYGLTGHMAKDCLKNGRSGSNRNGNDKKLAAKGKNCLLRFDDKIRFANLFTLDMHNFDIILGMDWLTKHCATIISHTKSVIFDDLDKPEFVYQDSQLGLLASIMDTSSDGPSLETHPVVRDFSDVFPKGLPGIPPKRKVEFSIELVPGTQAISKAL
nr:hypothetical protein [Tanacetum cinerariifolium]